MSTQEIEKYERNYIATNWPSAKIMNLDIKSKSWGWIATTKVSANIGQSLFTSEANTYYFKDRESYAVDFTSASEHFDGWYYVYEGTLENLKIRGIKVNESEPVLGIIPTRDESNQGGGCLIATATYDSELAPQVQQLRELRDNSLLNTEPGTSFMSTFNDFYYSFSP